MTKFLIAIDPGNLTGVVYGEIDKTPTVTSWDFTPKAKTKKREAEPKHLRYGQLWSNLRTRMLDMHNTGSPVFQIFVICEDAQGFMKGKSAVEVSNKYRGVVEAFAAYHTLPYTPIQPADLKRFATGKGVAEKSEMIAVARQRYGYEGNDDNEADALIMWHFLKEQLER